MDLISFVAFGIGMDEDYESVRRFSTLLRYAQILVIGPAVLHFVLQAKTSNSASSNFSAHR